MSTRREFITLLGGAAAAWPLAARAQQPEPMRRIGVLIAAADDPENQARFGGIPAGAAAIGLDRSAATCGSNPAGPRAMPRTRKHAAELVALAPDVILAHGTGALAPLLQATRAVPIVFVVADPVGAGFVESLARPGGNVTGFTSSNSA